MSWKFQLCRIESMAQSVKVLQIETRLGTCPRNVAGELARKGIGLEGEEVFIFIVSVALACFTFPFALGWFKHRMFIKRNPAAAVPMLAVVAALVWVGFVLRYYADPSVTTIYAIFYFVIGLAVIASCGFWTPVAYGLRVGVDILQRKNLAVAWAVGAFIFVTGMIYGGCLWGEADPVGDDEGGWWIPLGFFVMGWVVLLIAVGIYIRGEPHSLRVRLVQDRSLSEARAVACYMLGVGMVITNAVAGDFWGWWEGILGLLVVTLMMVTHELCRARIPSVLTTVETKSAGLLESRRLEALAYLVLASVFWVVQMYINRLTAHPAG
jgi:hypothetical protein